MRQRSFPSTRPLNQKPLKITQARKTRGGELGNRACTRMEAKSTEAKKRARMIRMRLIATARKRFTRKENVPMVSTPMEGIDRVWVEVSVRRMFRHCIGILRMVKRSWLRQRRMRTFLNRRTARRIKRLTWEACIRKKSLPTVCLLAHVFA